MNEKEDKIAAADMAVRPLRLRLSIRQVTRSATLDTAAMGTQYRRKRASTGIITRLTSSVRKLTIGVLDRVRGRKRGWRWKRDRTKKRSSAGEKKKRKASGKGRRKVDKKGVHPQMSEQRLHHMSSSKMVDNWSFAPLPTRLLLCVKVFSSFGCAACRRAPRYKTARLFFQRRYEKLARAFFF